MGDCNIHPSAMKRTIKIAKWCRYETHRVWIKSGLEDVFLDDDEKMLRALSTTFHVVDVKEFRSCSGKDAYNYIKRIGDGNYRKLLKV